MKSPLAILILLFVAQFVYAAEKDECPSAVEVAEAQNPNAYKDCDYSKTGLNGVLHRALAKKSESDEVNTREKETKNESTKALNEKNQKSVSKPDSLKDGEFNSPQQLQFVKFDLIEKIASICNKGFVVEGERYLPVVNTTMKLELVYHCL